MTEWSAEGADANCQPEKELDRPSGGSPDAAPVLREPARNGPDEDALRAASKVRRSIHLMARRLRVLRADHDISGSKLSTLARLFRAGRPMTATDLARLERLQPQSLTRIIADLEERGLIERFQDEADRRQMLIRITQGGSDLLVLDAYQQSRWLAQAMQSRLTKAEREIIAIATDLLDGLADQEDLPASLPGETGKPEGTHE